MHKYFELLHLSLPNNFLRPYTKSHTHTRTRTHRHRYTFTDKSDYKNQARAQFKNKMEV